MRDFRQKRPLFAVKNKTLIVHGLPMLAAVVCCCVAWGWLGVVAAAAADFVVHNKVYEGSDKTPCSQSTTIFAAGVVYDFLADAEELDEIDEIAVFDFARGRFLLLDTQLKLKTELSSKLVKAAIDSLKTRNDLANDPLTKFLLDPSFQTEINDETDELLFTSKWLDYRVLTSSPDPPEIAQDYRRFADWYARLRTFIRPGSLPPFARLLVNEELVKRGELPCEVYLTFRPKQGLLSRSIRFHSEHNLVPRLGEGDRRQIARAAKHLAVFEEVDFEQYNKKRSSSR